MNCYILFVIEYMKDIALSTNGVWALFSNRMIFLNLSDNRGHFVEKSSISIASKYKIFIDKLRALKYLPSTSSWPFYGIIS